MLVGACAVDGNELSRRQGRLDDFITRAQSSRLGWLTVHSSLSLSLFLLGESIVRSLSRFDTATECSRFGRTRGKENRRVNKKLD